MVCVCVCRFEVHYLWERIGCVNPYDMVGDTKNDCAILRVIAGWTQGDRWVVLVIQKNAGNHKEASQAEITP